MVKRQDNAGGRVGRVAAQQAVEIFVGREDERRPVPGGQFGGFQQGDALVVEAGFKRVWMVGGWVEGRRGSGATGGEKNRQRARHAPILSANLTAHKPSQA